MGGVLHYTLCRHVQTLCTEVLCDKDHIEGSGAFAITMSSRLSQACSSLWEISQNGESTEDQFFAEGRSE